MKTAQDLSFSSAEDAVNSYVRSNPSRTEPLSAFIFMGKTGAGKSSMIKLLGGIDREGNVPIVDGAIESCTQKPIVYEAELDNRKLLLLDTPGFDDSQRDNLEILREIVSHLYVFALKGNVVQVRGVIFLHDIIEVRMGGSQKKTWQILNAICGEEGMKNVLVGTTQWSKEGTNKFLAEERRETELIDKHWNGIYKSTRVIYNDRDNAVRIINDLLARPPVLLLVQTEMLKPPHTVEATTAGQVAMPEAYAEMQRLEKEMAEKQRKNEEEARRREEAHRKEQEEKRRQLEEERIRQEAEARRVAEVQRQEQIRLEEARRREAEEQRRKHEEELRRQAEAARILAQQEAQRRHEEEKRRIEEERRRWEEEQQRQREEMQRQEAERQRQWAEDNRRREEEAQRERERIQREIDHANHMRWQEEERQRREWNNRRRNDPCIIS